MKKIIQSESAPKAIGPYSQAIKAGKFVFVSGQIAINPKEGKIIAGSIGTQTKQVLDNINAVLQSVGYKLEDIVQANIYLSSMKNFGGFNSIYATFFKDDFPARAAVEARLPTDALLEISAIAFKE